MKYSELTVTMSVDELAALVNEIADLRNSNSSNGSALYELQSQHNALRDDMLYYQRECDRYSRDFAALYEKHRAMEISAGNVDMLRKENQELKQQLARAGMEDGDYSVTLDDFGNSKIEHIKLVRNLLALGLKDTKELVESAPVTLVTNVSAATAENIAGMIREIGGTAHITPNPNA